MARSSSSGLSGLLVAGAVAVGGYFLWQYLTPAATPATPTPAAPTNVATGTAGSNVGDTSGVPAGSHNGPMTPAIPTGPVRFTSPVVSPTQGVVSKRAPSELGSVLAAGGTVRGSNVALSGFPW